MTDRVGPGVEVFHSPLNSWNILHIHQTCGIIIIHVKAGSRALDNIILNIKNFKFIIMKTDCRSWIQIGPHLFRNKFWHQWVSDQPPTMHATMLALLCSAQLSKYLSVCSIGPSEATAMFDKFRRYVRNERPIIYVRLLLRCVCELWPGP